MASRESYRLNDKAFGFARGSLFKKNFPRSGQILPAPGRNVTVGDKEGSRCRAATKGGIWHRAAMTERVRAVLPQEAGAANSVRLYDPFP